MGNVAEDMERLRNEVQSQQCQIAELTYKNKYLEDELCKCKVKSIISSDVILDYETEYRREHEQLINARKVIKYLSSLL